jgi:(p)ppGpp synthase/HD superfamily hydrolase
MDEKSQEFIALCLKVATEAHKGQQRRGGDPYITHPLRVSNTFENVVKQCVAILHDVLEDTDETEESLIDKGITVEIVGHVKLLTKSPDQSYEDYLEAIKQCSACRDVKIADIVDNLTSDPTPKQIKKYREALWILSRSKYDMYKA